MLISNEVNKMLQKKKSKDIKRSFKVYSQVQSNANITFSGSAYDLYLCNIGTGLNTRTNTKTYLGELRINIEFFIGTLTISSILESTIHVVLVKWKESTVAGNPSASDILDPITSGVGTTNAPLVPTNRSQTDSQFDILYEEIIQLDEYHPVALRSIVRKLNYYSEFDGSNTGPNHPILFLISDDGAATYPTMQFSSQIVFSDAA